MSYISDYVVIGSGITGSTIARHLSDAGNEVTIIERRGHLGGNVHDYVHESGIVIHTYGPHYFRTSSERIWNFVNRFDRFREFNAILKCFVDGRYERWPLTPSTVQRLYGTDRPEIEDGRPVNFEEDMLSSMPLAAYDQFVRGYTRKQWGCDPRKLSSDLTTRIELRDTDDPRLKLSRYQGLPISGYASFMAAMVAGIRVIKGVDYLEHRNEFKARQKLIYTGSIDTLFDYRFGRLQWRSQSRRHVYLPGELKLPCVQVNYPDENESAIRVIEWAHMMPPEASFQGTVLTYETPFSPDVPDAFEYPFPDEQNRVLFKRYMELAKQEPNLIVCGRLGEYRYLDMDQAIGRALTISGRLIE
jgi:UDP-galactopyranose mutase